MSAPAPQVPAPSVFIATPALDGQVNAHYTASLLRTQSAFARLGWNFEISFEIGNSLVTDARNKLVARFLGSAHTDLVFIDADISWQAEDLVRLLRHDADVVAGVYQRKSRAKLDFTVKFGPRITRDAQGLMTVDRVGTGFLRIRRPVLEHLVRCHPELQLKHPTEPGNPHLHALFDTAIVDGEYVGEDFTFCDRWRRAGGQVKIDAAIALSHHGAAVYDEPLMKYLTRN